ncbi:MAG TPA: ABC transporter ATP-binding protein [Streptosporangiaceae bacterium]|nr:ABC transporter ATP-binding protein [Streptosporangiaceae bacterium]
MPDRLPGALVSLGRSLRLGYRAEPRLLIVGFVTTVAAAAPDALLALALSALVAAVVGHEDRAVLAASLSLGLLVTVGWLLSLASERVNVRLTDRAAVFIESHMARLHIEVPTIEHHERLDYVDRLTLLRDQAATLSELYQMLFSEIGAVLRLVITIAILISVRPVLGLLGLFAIPPVLASHWRAGAERRTEEAVAVHERLARSLFLLGTTADAAKEARVGQVQPMLVRRSAAERLARYRAMARARMITATWVSLGYVCFGAALVAGVGLAASGKDAAAKVVLLLAAGSRLSQYVSQTVRETHLFRSIWLDGSRRLAWLEDYAHAHTPAVDATVPVVLRDGITLEHVSFRYPGTERQVLTDISLKLPAGRVVAIVGENGAGKSTLIKLLCGFYQPTSGRITIDGVDLQAVDIRAWRSTLTGAFQDFVKFEYPLAEAVGIGDLSRLADAAAITAALRKAGADNLVASLGNGLGSQLGASWPDGVELSHGQWQKIALARGFMPEQPLMVVLDEPTSAFDAQAEQEMFDRYAVAAAESARTGQITVLVSHRFSTVRMADLIVVLDGAHVAEAGSHADLMARGGSYAELFAIQAAGYAHTTASEVGSAGG